MSSQFSFHLQQLLFSLFPFVCSVTLFLSPPLRPISPIPLYSSLFLLSLCQTQCGLLHHSLATLVWDPLPSSHKQRSHKVKSTHSSYPLSLPPFSKLHTPESLYQLSGRIRQCPAEHSQTRGIPAIPAIRASVRWWLESTDNICKSHVFFGPRLWGKPLPCFSPPPRGLHFMFDQQRVGRITCSIRKTKRSQQPLPEPHYSSVSQLQALVPHPP